MVPTGSYVPGIKKELSRTPTEGGSGLAGSCPIPRWCEAEVAEAGMKYNGPRVGSGPGTYGRGQHKHSKWFKYSQIIGPLLPIPVGC